MEQSKNINRGTGAGGANTNLNGLSFENKFYKLFSNNINKKIIKYGYTQISINNTELIYCKKSQFRNYMNSRYLTDYNIPVLSGCKNPDCVIIDIENKKIYIIEIKYQNSNGSTLEKIQTACMKQENYNERYPNYNIEYIYCFSEWFKNNCYAELHYLKKKNIKYYFIDSDMSKLINYICNVSS